jgi:hypothetical protein
MPWKTSWASRAEATNHEVQKPSPRYFRGRCGQTLITADWDPERVRLWVEPLTAVELDPGGEIRTLTPAAIQARRRQLDGLGWTLP